MKRGHKFLLDADTFIRAHRQHYRFTFCPAYWKALLLHHGSGNVASISQVRKELLRGKDDLSKWVKDRIPDAFFKGTEDANVVRAYSAITKWVMALPNLSSEAQAYFAGSADGWLVAFAKVNGYSVCTYEVSAPESKSNIKLPDIAAKFGVACGNPYAMLEHLGVRMLLSKKSADA